MGRDKELEVIENVVEQLRKLGSYESQNRVLVYARDRLKAEEGRAEKEKGVDF